MSGLCQCGCGLPAPIAVETSKRYGYMKGQPKRFIHGHNGHGMKRKFSDAAKKNISSAQKKRFSDRSAHPRWKGGLVFEEGYWRVMVPEHPRASGRGYVKRCILVLEKKLDRPLFPDEVPHHINGDKADDREENLSVMNFREHDAHHCRENWSKGIMRRSS
jgi:hypothetical protein